MTEPNGQFHLYGPSGDLIAHGSMSALTERVLDSKARNDAISLLEDAAKAVGLLEQQQDYEQQLRQREVRAFCDGVAAIGRRLDALEATRAARARHAAADEARRIQEKLDALPDPDDPSAPAHLTPPANCMRWRRPPPGPATRARYPMNSCARRRPRLAPTQWSIRPSSRTAPARRRRSRSVSTPMIRRTTWQ
jgi:hypothetical protein